MPAREWYVMPQIDYLACVRLRYGHGSMHTSSGQFDTEIDLVLGQFDTEIDLVLGQFNTEIDLVLG